MHSENEAHHILRDSLLLDRDADVSAKGTVSPALFPKNQHATARDPRKMRAGRKNDDTLYADTDSSLCFERASLANSMIELSSDSLAFCNNGNQP
jgi:hypothetical protein